MLSDKEIEEIKKLIYQDKKDYKIGKELRYSPNTVKKVRKKFTEVKVNQKQGEEMHFTSPIDKLREEVNNFDKTGKKGNAFSS